MGSSRFVKEAALEDYVTYVKGITTKPVVTVGRFTSPDSMVSQIRRGITDFIGAARPSIADPFLPNKIREGEIDSIRECIGCNVCYSGDGMGVPIHCTQNPTFSEGWRRGWHPEKIAKSKTDATVLVIGAGPAGLEATRALGQRGYHVLLAEKTATLGGRVSRESTLPGLAEWIRVRDYRVRQIQRMPNVDVYLDSCMNADSALETGAEHIVVATGAYWRADGFGRYNEKPVFSTSLPSTSLPNTPPENGIYTPDHIFNDFLPAKEQGVTIYDDDHYYLGGVLAEHLTQLGYQVRLISPESKVSAWTEYTEEQHRIQAGLMSLGIEIITSQGVTGFDGQQLTTCCVYSDVENSLACQQLVTVTARTPNDHLYHKLVDKIGQGNTAGKPTIARIGDCDAPSIIATAVFAGHRYARELEEPVDIDNPLKYDRVYCDG